MYKKSLLFFSLSTFFVLPASVVVACSNQENNEKNDIKQKNENKNEALTNKQLENFNKINESLKRISSLLPMAQGILGFSLNVEGDIQLTKEQFFAINSLSKRGLRYMPPNHLNEVVGLAYNFLPNGISQENLSKTISYLLNDGGFSSLFKDEDLNFVQSISNAITTNLENEQDKQLVNKYLNKILLTGYQNHRSFIEDTNSLLNVFNIDTTAPIISNIQETDESSNDEQIAEDDNVNSDKPQSPQEIDENPQKDNLNQSQISENSEETTSSLEEETIAQEEDSTQSQENTFQELLKNVNIENVLELATLLYWNDNKEIRNISNVFVENVDLNSLFVIIQKGVLNTNKNDWNNLFSSLNNILEAEIKLNEGSEPIKITDFISEDLRNFIEKISEELNSKKIAEVIDKLIKKGIAFIDESDLQYLSSTLEVFLPFIEQFIGKDNSYLNMVKTLLSSLENKEYILEDILENGISASESVTASEKLFFFNQLITDMLNFDLFSSPVIKAVFDIEKDLLAPLFDLDLEKMPIDDKKTMLNRLETQYSSMENQKISFVEETITNLKSKSALDNSLIEQYINARKLLIKTNVGEE